MMQNLPSSCMRTQIWILFVNIHDSAYNPSKSILNYFVTGKLKKLIFKQISRDLASERLYSVNSALYNVNFAQQCCCLLFQTFLSQTFTEEARLFLG